MPQQKKRRQPSACCYGSRMVVSPDRPTRRRDAEANHARLLAAATDVFSEQGLSGSLEEIARRAGVGPGTLYRHFPTRDDLVDSIFEARFASLVEIADDALRSSDAWQGLVGFIEDALTLQACDRGLRDVMLQARLRETRLTTMRRKLEPRLGRLVERARTAGQLRPDFEPSDLAVLFWMLATVVDTTAAIHPDLWRRQLTLVLDGLRATQEAPTTLPVRALTKRELTAARRAHAERRSGGRPSPRTSSRSTA